MVAYVLLLTGGIFGLHWIYLGDSRMYRLYALTLGFCGIGVLVDLFRMPELIAAANSETGPRRRWSDLGVPSTPLATAQPCRVLCVPASMCVSVSVCACGVWWARVVLVLVASVCVAQVPRVCLRMHAARARNACTERVSSPPRAGCHALFVKQALSASAPPTLTIRPPSPCPTPYSLLPTHFSDAARTHAYKKHARAHTRTRTHTCPPPTRPLTILHPLSLPPPNVQITVLARAEHRRAQGAARRTRLPPHSVQHQQRPRPWKRAWCVALCLRFRV